MAPKVPATLRSSSNACIHGFTVSARELTKLHIQGGEVVAKCRAFSVFLDDSKGTPPKFLSRMWASARNPLSLSPFRPVPSRNNASC